MPLIGRKKKPWNFENVRKDSQQVDSQTVIVVDGNVVKLSVKDYPISTCCHSESLGRGGIIRMMQEVVERFKNGAKNR